METSNYTPPSDEDIQNAQKKLGVNFPPDYISFIKSGYDMGDSILEPLEIKAEGRHVDIFKTVQDARKLMNLPEDLLPICEDNSDYYCLRANGEVVFWSHNGISYESWASVSVWREHMSEEA